MHWESGQWLEKTSAQLFLISAIPSDRPIRPDGNRSGRDLWNVDDLGLAATGNSPAQNGGQQHNTTLVHGDAEPAGRARHGQCGAC